MAESHCNNKSTCSADNKDYQAAESIELQFKWFVPSGIEKVLGDCLYIVEDLYRSRGEMVHPNGLIFYSETLRQS